MSKKRAGREHVGRPANEPQKYPKSVRECQHRTDNFSAGCQIITAVAEGAAQPPEVVGHILRITEIHCLECGQEFRFCNLPINGNVMEVPLMSNGNRDMHTRIEPDRLVISPADARGGKHTSKIITRGRLN